MDYCTIADVQTYVANFVFGKDSNPTDAQVVAMCTDMSENYIDPVISRSIALPVTNPVGLQYLQQWAVNCVLASVYRAIESEPELLVIYDNKCQAFKDDFMNDPGLIDTPFSQPVAGIPKGSTRPTIKWQKNEEQW